MRLPTGASDNQIGRDPAQGSPPRTFRGGWIQVAGIWIAAGFGWALATPLIAGYAGCLHADERLARGSGTDTVVISTGSPLPRVTTP